MAYDAEIIGLIATTIAKLNLGKFIININNRKLVMGFLQALKVMDKDQVLHLLDSSEKISESQLKKELSLLRLDTFEVRQLLKFSRLKGEFTQVLSELANFDLNNTQFNQELQELVADRKSVV